ncbi:hypothetical protein [Wolbachia endosymbiont of Folsomia candida]|uniref:hypothetical protein n=1 Tax=Wolbachia endosymbiont of Folsomia candida TaxID=169402 RepID=UPI000A7B236E|nr:hypothetical protein [Wolbachia endosymbiont of Folsomia candida]APR98925.1 hypothetical protein ASM33_06975 [Wolbachia endosymbiont of Folsomia candida]
MSDYLLDSQMIKEDISWLKKTNHIAFQELHDQIENMQDQDPEVKKTFDDYCNQINSLEERKALKYTAAALAAVFIGTLAVTILTGSTSAAFIAAVTGIIAVAICGYLLCGSKLESVQLETIKNPPQRPVG